MPFLPFGPKVLAQLAWSNAYLSWTWSCDQGSQPVNTWCRKWGVGGSGRVKWAEKKEIPVVPFLSAKVTKISSFPLVFSTIFPPNRLPLLQVAYPRTTFQQELLVKRPCVQRHFTENTLKLTVICRLMSKFIYKS